MRKFLVVVLMQTNVTASMQPADGDNSNVSSETQAHLASFFSTSMEDVDMSESSFSRSGDDRRVSKSLELTGIIVVKQDYDLALAQMEVWRVNLQQFLSGQGQALTVTGMKYSCGEGHTPTRNFVACEPCNVNQYKSALDNTSCVDCPENSNNTNSTMLASSIQVCECGFGFRASLLPNASRYCESILELETVQQVSNVVSGLVGTVIAAQVAGSVLLSVTSAVSTSITSSVAGASVGGGSGASASASQGARGSMALVCQVQFLTVTGKVGGSSPALKKFSRGFEFSNYRFGVTASSGESGDRRSAITNTTQNACAWDQDTQGAAETCVTCVVCLVAVFLLRNLLCICLERCLHRDISTGLLFPAW